MYGLPFDGFQFLASLEFIGFQSVNDHNHNHRFTTKDSYTWNITHNAESIAVWILRPQRWGSPVFQEEKYQEEKTCDNRHADDDNDDDGYDDDDDDGDKQNH